LLTKPSVLLPTIPYCNVYIHFKASLLRNHELLTNKKSRKCIVVLSLYVCVEKLSNKI